MGELVQQPRSVKLAMARRLLDWAYLLLGWHRRSCHTCRAACPDGGPVCQPGRVVGNTISDGQRQVRELQALVKGDQLSLF